MSDKKIIEEFREKFYPRDINNKPMKVDKEPVVFFKKGLEDLEKFCISKLVQQKQELLDELIAEIFIRKDGILPLRNVWIKPNEIRKIRRILKKAVKEL